MRTYINIKDTTGILVLILTSGAISGSFLTCYNCTGTWESCGRERKTTDDSTGCDFSSDWCIMSRATWDGEYMYIRYCYYPGNILACQNKNQFGCEIYEGTRYCDICCDTDHCNTWEWTYNMSTVTSDTSGSDNLISTTDSYTDKSSETSTAAVKATTSVTTTAKKTRVTTSAATTAEQTTSTKSSRAAIITSMTISHSQTAEEMKGNDSQTLISTQGSITGFTEDTGEQISVSSQKPFDQSSETSKVTMKTTTASTGKETETMTTKLLATSQARTSTENPISCYKCRGGFAECATARNSRDTTESCTSKEYYCAAIYEVQEGGISVIYERKCANSSDPDIQVLCPELEMGSCIRNKCAQCCDSNLCNDFVWIYSSAASHMIWLKWLFLQIQIILAYTMTNA